jgi:hypothetical protein
MGYRPTFLLRGTALTALLALALGVMFVPAGAQPLDAPQDTITLTSPNNLTIGDADDYATQVLADPWDMNNLDDVDFPYKFGVPTLANGVWSNTTTGPDAVFYLQHQNFPGVYSYLGEKDGINHPIETGRFRRLQMRVNVSQGGQAVVWWYRARAVGGASGNSNFVQLQPGWRIYDVDLTAGGQGGNGNWLGEGTVSGLRVDAPWGATGNRVQIDWARLVPDSTSAVNIAWNYTSSGNPTVNLYLSHSPTATEGNEHLIASVPAANRSYNWTRAGVAPGTYYIHAEMNGAWSSSGPLHVNTAPVARIDAPSPISGEEFSQARLGYSWDGRSQFQMTESVTNLIETPEYVQGTATNIDPQVSWLFIDQAHPIDTNRYRYMTMRLWLQAPSGRPNSPWNAGPRMTWAYGDRTDWVQTQAVLAPYNRWIPLTYDLAVTPTEPSGALGWSGQPTSLRFDVHEEDDAFGGEALLPNFFRIANAHLTSRPISGPGTIIRWSALQGGGSVDLYWDNNNSGYDGTLIAYDVPLAAGAYNWNTSALPNGTYWVYIFARDAYNRGRWYSLVPLVVDHASPSTLFSDVPTNNAFAADINDLAMRGIIAGYVQPDNSWTFRPTSYATRAQLSKMVVLAAGGQPINPPSPTFVDVPPSHVLYGFVEAAVRRGIISGYECGSPGEPCDAQRRPYFRPNNNVTRAQTTKMVVTSRGWQNEPVGQNPTFRDVPTNYAFYSFIEIAARHGIIGGYADGTFRPGNPVTRAQLSKMISRSISGLGSEK